jgi:protein-disulfide isomerase
MPLTLARLLVSALLLACTVASPVRAEMNSDDKRQIEQIVRDYILQNPEVVEKALIALETQRREAKAAGQAAKITELRDTILNSDHQAVLGNPDGRITLVEFFDYNCGYCKRALNDMLALMESDPNLRVVMKEFPILSEGSMEAARISIAVKDLKPELYLDYHRELLARGGQANLQKALSVATELGLDADALKKAADDGTVSENIQEVQQLAQALGISGTPSYIVGGEMIPGAVGFDQLQSRIQAAAAKCAEQVMC